MDDHVEKNNEFYEKYTKLLPRTPTQFHLLSTPSSCCCIPVVTACAGIPGASRVSPLGLLVKLGARGLLFP
jgi:hypothetical protein